MSYLKKMSDLDRIGPDKEFKTFEEYEEKCCGGYTEKNENKAGSIEISKNAVPMDVPKYQRPAPFKIKGNIG